MDNKKDVKEQFGRSANSYVQSRIHKSGKDLSLLQSLTQLNGTEHVLDVATGAGHTANAFAPHVAKVTALDLTEKMLSAAEKFIRGNGNENVEFISGDAEKLPFADQSFDIVTCRIAPHHFSNVEAFISEVYRVLKHGGKFLLDDNVAPEDDELDKFYNKIEKIRDYSHFRAWKKTEWMKMLESSGFTINQFHHFEKTFLFSPWCDRMHLASEVQKELAEILKQAPLRVKEKFRITLERGEVKSFAGEAVVIYATK